MIEKLISFFKQSFHKTKNKIPEGVCPNCWGYQGYDNTIRELYFDRQIDINNHIANYAFIKDIMVNHIDGITLKKGNTSLECPTCKKKY